MKQNKIGVRVNWKNKESKELENILANTICGDNEECQTKAANNLFNKYHRKHENICKQLNDFQVPVNNPITCNEGLDAVKRTIANHFAFFCLTLMV